MPNFVKALLVGFCVLLSSCSGGEAVQDARKDIDVFHRHLDAGNVDAVWQAASEDLTGTASKQEFAGLMGAVHEQLGNVISTKQVGWKRDVNTTGNFVTVNMDTTFERGTGDEEFVYRLVDDKLQLAGYHINWKRGEPKGEESADQTGEEPAQPAASTET